MSVQPHHDPEPMPAVKLVDFVPIQAEGADPLRRQRTQGVRPVSNEGGRSAEERIDELENWWVRQSNLDAGMVARKAVEYGSNSLTQMGAKLAQLQGMHQWDDSAVPESWLQELGIWFYVVSKVERWTDAVMRGEQPSDDTLCDISVYAMMARRVRDAGGWPDSNGV